MKPASTPSLLSKLSQSQRSLESPLGTYFPGRIGKALRLLIPEETSCPRNKVRATGSSESYVTIFMTVMSPNNMLAVKSVCCESGWWQESVKSLGKTKPIMNSESANLTGDSMYGDQRESTPSCTMCPSNTKTGVKPS